MLAYLTALTMILDFILDDFVIRFQRCVTVGPTRYL